jgi:predicted dehydrogenase
MKKKLNIGIVGFGYMGKMHAMCYENIKYYYKSDINVCLYAVVSSKGKENLPIEFERYYRTIDELLEDEAVDVIDICSPNYLHKELLLKAIAKNKHIYCEKPLTIDLESATTVINFMKESKYSSVNRVTFEYRFTPAIIRAKQIIEAGGIGKIINFNFKYYGSEFIDPNKAVSWQSMKALSGGGVLLAMGTHSIDLIYYLIGEIKDVFAQKKTHYKMRPLKENKAEERDVDIEDIVNIQLTCENDVMGSLLLSQVAAGSSIDLTFEIYGEKGTIKFTHDNPNHIYYYDNDDIKEPVGGYSGFKEIETTQKYGGAAVFPPPRVTISWSRYHIASIYDFLNAIACKSKSQPDFQDGYAVQRVTDAIYKSTESGNIEKIK